MAEDSLHCAGRSCREVRTPGVDAASLPGPRSPPRGVSLRVPWVRPGQLLCCACAAASTKRGWMSISLYLDHPSICSLFYHRPFVLLHAASRSHACCGSASGEEIPCPTTAAWPVPACRVRFTVGV